MRTSEFVGWLEKPAWVNVNSVWPRRGEVVLFFDRRVASEKPWTKKLWVPAPNVSLVRHWVHLPRRESRYC